VPTALHRVRFGWGATTHIDIEWANGEGEVMDTPPGAANLEICEREKEIDEFAQRGVPAICWTHDPGTLFEPLQLRENTDYLIDVGLPISKAEAILLSEQRRSWPFGARLGRVFKRDPHRRWIETEQGTVVVSGQLRLRNHAGVLDLGTQFGTPLRVEVVCRKMNYGTEFRTLLNEVAEQLAELILEYDSPVSLSLALSSSRSGNPAGALFQLRYVMAEQNLPLAVEEIISEFHTQLHSSLVMQPIAEVSEPSIDAITTELDVSSFFVGGPLSTLFRGYTPCELPVPEIAEIVDTSENRYVKYFLEECSLLADWLVAGLESRGKSASAAEAAAWRDQLQEMLFRGIWRDVGVFRQFPSNSQVLLRKRGYREILRFDLALHMGLQLPWSEAEHLADGLLGDIRPVSQLYEYWCFFLLRRALRDLCAAEIPSKHGFVQFSKDGLQVRLSKGKRSRIDYQYREVGQRKVRVSLFYNRRFQKLRTAGVGWQGSYTASFDPDYSVVITASDGAVTERHWLHFDAKYRMESADVKRLFAEVEDETASEIGEDGEAEYEKEIRRTHKREDLFKMHTYRDGILSTRGAYILFPGTGTETRLCGNDQNFFVRHPSAFGNPAPAVVIPSVGAFDLCPGRVEEQLPPLKTFLSRVLEAVTDRSHYQEETGFDTATPLSPDIHSDPQA
jgi:uncharacterized protein